MADQSTKPIVHIPPADVSQVADKPAQTFPQWLTAIANAYWDINFTEFCRRAGFAEDDYAEEKWAAWLRLAADLKKFDAATLERIVRP